VHAGPTPLRGERWLWLLCALLVGVGIYFRARNLDLPVEFSFDERHFVKNARRYLVSYRDGNDHPPFGKLLMAFAIGVFGDHPWSWRVPSFLAGLANIGLAAALARALFRDRIAAVLAAAFVAADGFLLVYSRTALLDGPLTALILASALVSFTARRPAHVGIAAMLAGAAACVKFSGIVALVPVLLACFANGLPRSTLAFVAFAPLTYWLLFAAGLAANDLLSSPMDVVTHTARLYNEHLTKTEWTHRWVSPWYTWFLPVRPVVMRLDKAHGVIRTMSSLGNLAVWWGSELVVLGTIVSVLRSPRAWIARVRETAPGLFGADARAICWLLLMWALPILPWVVTRRDSYVYHYLPAYVFGVILLAGATARLFRIRPHLGWVVLGLVATVFVLYLPIWAELPISRGTWQALLFLHMWR
jgi:dolichyl-phosphate-mannose-protein mannosyltransferase